MGLTSSLPHLLGPSSCPTTSTCIRIVCHPLQSCLFKTSSTSTFKTPELQLFVHKHHRNRSCIVQPDTPRGDAVTQSFSRHPLSMAPFRNPFGKRPSNSTGISTIDENTPPTRDASLNPLETKPSYENSRASSALSINKANKEPEEFKLGR